MSRIEDERNNVESASIVLGITVTGVEAPTITTTLASLPSPSSSPSPPLLSPPADNFPIGIVISAVVGVIVLAGTGTVGFCYLKHRSKSKVIKNPSVSC